MSAHPEVLHRRTPPQHSAAGFFAVSSPAEARTILSYLAQILPNIAHFLPKRGAGVAADGQKSRTLVEQGKSAGVRRERSHGRAGLRLLEYRQGWTNCNASSP